jgi:site-specific DNA-methyltransferase (adenine-specific)
MNYRNITDIKSNPKNPRVIKDDKFAKLVQSIKDFPEMLEKRPLVCFTDTDGKIVVLGGNMRLKAAKECGLKQLPVLLADDWTEEQKAQFLIKDNVGFGEWNWDELQSDWDVKQLEEWGLDLPKEFNIDAEAEEDDFDTTPPAEPITVLGDLYEIGEHRLLCGDSTDSELIEKLLQGKKPELLLTDPPYGIDYGGMLKGKGDGKGGADKNGWKSYDAPDWDKSKPESGVLQYICQITENQIIWGGNYFTDDLPPTMGWLIWDKGQRGFSLADGEMAWTSFNNALRIKEYARAKANQEEKNHPTQKPQEIMQWCFEYADRHSKIEIKLVLDAYLGSGSTMVASHQLKRKCYGMELDPKYCDVIVKRMIKLDPSLIIKRNGKQINNEDYAI